MSNDFQPEKPYASEPGPRRRPASVWIALLSALGVIMVLAVLLPQFLAQESGANWWITLGAGAVVFVVVWAIGWRKGAKSEQPTWSGEDAGEK